MFSKIEIKEVHIHFAGMDAVLDALANLQSNLGETIMATKDEVLAAIAAEKDEVAAAVAALTARIDELIAAGTGATADDLAEIAAAVQGIFTAP
jgi:hypothetical protein